MKIAGISVVHNEVDIIEPFVRHTLKFVDTLSVMDHASVDGTKGVLRKLELEFEGRLTVSDDDSFADVIATRVNRLLKRCVADYVVPLDADEFIAARSREEFECYLARIPEGGCGITFWQTFVLVPGCKMESDPPRSMYMARVTESPHFSKIILHLPNQQAGSISLFAGNHEMSNGGQEFESIIFPVPLMHFPIRSRGQLLGKGAVNWMSHCAEHPDARTSNMNYHKRELFDAILAGGDMDEATVCRLSMLYAQNERPIEWSRDVFRVVYPFDYQRKYSNGRPMAAIPLILRTWEQWMASR